MKKYISSECFYPFTSSNSLKVFLAPLVYDACTLRCQRQSELLYIQETRGEISFIKLQASKS